MRIVIDYSKTKEKRVKKPKGADIVERFLSFYLAGNYYSQSIDSIFVDFIENPKLNSKLKRRTLYGHNVEIEVLQTFDYGKDVTVPEFSKIFDEFLKALVHLDEIKIKDFNNEKLFRDLEELKVKLPKNDMELKEINRISFKDIEDKIYQSRNNNPNFDKRQQAKQIPLREIILHTELEKNNKRRTIPIWVQSDYFTRYVRKEARKLKFKGQYHTVSIVLSDRYAIKKGIEGLSILIPFDLEKYREVYPPFEVDLPLKGLIPKNNEQAINNFIAELMLDAFKYAKSQNIYLPIDELIRIIEEFRENNYKFEWYHKSRPFKELGVKARLHCKLTNYCFALDFVLLKGKKEIYRKEIRKSQPWHEAWRNYYEDIVLNDNYLVVTRQYAGEPIFKISVDEILKLINVK